MVPFPALGLPLQRQPTKPHRDKAFSTWLSPVRSPQAAHSPLCCKGLQSLRPRHGTSCPFPRQLLFLAPMYADVQPFIWNLRIASRFLARPHPREATSSSLETRPARISADTSTYPDVPSRQGSFHQLPGHLQLSPTGMSLPPSSLQPQATCPCAD